MSVSVVLGEGVIDDPWLVPVHVMISKARLKSKGDKRKHEVVARRVVSGI